MQLPACRTALAAVFIFIVHLSPAHALLDATPDESDRFPFVVAVEAEGRLICSGTVLYPRIVVTAAHCVQKVAMWRSTRFYVNDYIPAETLSVTVVEGGSTRSFAVVEVSVSPRWRQLASSQRSDIRLPYDLALLITENPVELGGQQHSLNAVALTPQSIAGSVESRGVLVGFGGTSCIHAGECTDAGVRRFLPVAMKDSSACFKRRYEASLRLSVLCVDAAVMPGDSGGALLVAAPDGALRYAGVISAWRGPPLMVPRVKPVDESAITSLTPSLAFIAEKARELGYAPIIEDP